MTKSKNITKEKVEPLVEVKEEKKESQWYVFCSTGCGFCKKAEPVVEELNASGKYPEILKLDLADGDTQKLANELKKEYNVQCGTPWFINAETGKGICGFREKDVVEKWLNGEDIPAPPRPKGPIPKPPFHGAPDKEVNKWKEDYTKWLEENSHLPKTQTAEQILERPRPKTDPPRPPLPNSSDEQLDKWVKEYDKWKDENGHLPNLQPADMVISRFKAQRDKQLQQPSPPPTNLQSAPPPSSQHSTELNTQFYYL